MPRFSNESLIKLLRRIIGLCVATGLLNASTTTAFDGAALFAQKCADCHGELGQGTDYYKPSLAGDLPVSELARVIADTMPEGDPESVVGAEAEAIARHAHEAFYSPLAQARIRPPRRELSRLTVRQYQQTMADLLAEFRGQKQPGEERGLKVHFHHRVNAARVGESKEIRMPRIDFRLTELSELPESFRDPDAKGKEEFGNSRIDVDARTSGGIVAPSTGDYEFIVRTTAAIELDVNGEPVIAAKVRSDTEPEPELRGTIHLTGGRVYPFQLSTSRTRADDLKISLAWRPPGSIEETIPHRALIPNHFPKVFTTSAPFPPDDRSVGYVRGASISADWDEATTIAALDAVQTVVDDFPSLAKHAGISEPSSIETMPREEAIDFCDRFGAAALRRPLTAGEQERLITTFFSEDRTQTEAVELALLSILKSPRFLYPELALLDAPSDQAEDYSRATRLALGLWDSLPDKRLRQAAQQGDLHKTEQVREHAKRMLDDFRTHSKLAEFFEHWLRLDHVAKLSRDPERFPDFNDRVAADMRTSLELLLDDIVWQSKGDLRELFLSEKLYVNKRLAEFLGIDPPADDPEIFTKAPVDSHQRAGVVSHPFVVTAFSYYRETSPIHRGVFLARHVLGRSLRPPPEAVAPLAPELAPDMTTRERVATQTSPGACQACHVLINDLGFTLEHFDAVGRFRDQELNKPIDATGGYIATDGGTVRLQGARDLANFLADSEDVHRSFVTQLFEHVTKQPMLAYGVETRERLLADFRAGGFDIRDLLVEIATTAAIAESKQAIN